jgi:alpha-tubulin suppressor-like RCC1 family protein
MDPRRSIAARRARRAAVLLAALVVGTSSALTASGAPSAPTFVSISAGSLHTCAVTSSGGSKCWGSNIQATVGNGTTTAVVRRPVDVSGLKSGVKTISAGGHHTCALTRRGGVKCWGSNTFGAVGSSTRVTVKTPFAVPSLKSGVRTLTTGTGFNERTCVVARGGAAKCWGDNGQGFLGTGSKESVLTRPSVVVGLTRGVSAISGGGLSFMCAVVNGSARCWGGNSNGQLGNGTTTSSPIPVGVSGLTSGVSAIAAGMNHVCALVSGGVKCWGSGVQGQLGNGGRTSLTPVDAVGLASGVRTIAAGGGHNCAITSTGAVKCWGDNDFGQLGNGSTTDSSTPVDVVGLPRGVVSLSAGIQHTCAITSSGKAMCWGGNQFGQLGNGTTKGSMKPVAVRP